MLVRPLEIVRHALLEIVMAVVAMQAAGRFGMGVDIATSTLRRERYSRRLLRHSRGCPFALLWSNSGE